MPVIDRAYSGSAAQATLMTAMTPSSPTGGGTITVSDDSGYPTSGKFEIVIDRGTENEENVLIASRSGTTFTISQRAYDGSVARTHTSGVALVEADLSGSTMQKIVDHVDDVESDPHSTKLLNNARHDLEARHTFGGAYGTPVAPADVTTAANAGTGNNPSREDHAHKLGTGAINASAMFAAGVVDAAAIGADQVGTSEIAPDAVTAAEIAANAVGSSELADNSVDTAAIQNAAVTGPKLGDTLTTTVFTGSGTWTKPAGLRYVRVRLVGGGGGSGGVAATGGNAASAGGGGGGGYSEETIAAASLGATETVTVGAGGSAGASGNNNGGGGGTTSFGAHLAATGGGGGDGGAAGTDVVAGGGSGGAGSAGSVNMPGAQGGLGIVTGGISIRNGDGGSSLLGVVRFCNSTGSAAGLAGNNYGGGAAGAINGAGAGAKAGAAGAAGIVIVEEYA